MDKDSVGNTLASIGVEFSCQFYQIEGKKVKVTYTDTAGQERFDAINKNYMVKADGIFLVYDITNRDSFDKIDMWSEQIKEATKEVEIVLLGNKVDLANEREVSYEEGEEKAKELKCVFFETSAMDGTNVKEAFDKMVNILVNSEAINNKKGKGKKTISPGQLRRGSLKKKDKENDKKCCGGDK